MLTRPYQSRFNPQTNVAADRPGLPAGASVAPGPAPVYPGMDVGGGGGGVGSMFQRSLARERAQKAFKAATFAQNAPAAAPGQSAYGNDQAAAAARTAYVAGKMADANAEDFGQGANVYQRAGLVADANSRANQESDAAADLSGAQAGEIDARSRGLDAYTRTVLPTIAAQNSAAAQATLGGERRANLLIPSQIGALNAQTRGANATAAGAEAMLPFIPKTEQLKLDQGRAEIERGQATLPTILAQGQAQAEATRGQAALLNSQAKAAATPQTPAVDPFDQYAKRGKAVQEEADRIYKNQGLSSWIPFVGYNRGEALAQAEKNVPQPAAPAQPLPPEGTMGTDSQGRRFKIVNGKPVLVK